MRRSTETPLRWTPLSTAERSWRRAPVSSCTLAMVREETLEISSRISFCSVTYFLKASTVCEISLGRQASFTALSDFPVAADPGRLDAGKMSTPPRPVVVDVAGADTDAVVVCPKPVALVALRLPRDRPVEVVVVVCPNPGSPGAPVLNGIPPKREVADVVVAVVVVEVVVAEAVLATVARGVVVVAPNPAKLGTVVAAVVGADVALRLPKREAAAVVVTAATVVVAVPVVTAAVVVAEPKAIGRDGALCVTAAVVAAVVVACGVTPNPPKPVDTAGVEPNGIAVPVPKVTAELTAAAVVAAGMPKPTTEAAVVAVGTPKPPANGVAAVVAGVVSAPKLLVGAAPNTLAGAAVPKPVDGADDATGVIVTPEGSPNPPNGAADVVVVVAMDVATPKPPNPTGAAEVAAAGSVPKPPKPVGAVDAGVGAGAPKPPKLVGAAAVDVPKLPNPVGAAELVAAGTDPKLPNAGTVEAAGVAVAPKPLKNGATDAVGAAADPRPPNVLCCVAATAWVVVG